MNGRRLFREYAQSKGKEAVEFVEIKSEVNPDLEPFIDESEDNGSENLASFQL
jgi:hypothetical protein